MEEDSIPTRKPHSKYPQQNAALHPKPTRQGQGKSSSSSSSHMVQFLIKALFFAIFIMVVPMFPSQAPDFVSNHALLTKFWELIHLVFIGIAVSYGLFSTRNADMGFENDANVGDSESLMPRIFPVSSCFDYGYENPCGSGEKIVLEGWDSQCFVGKTVSAMSESNETTVFGGQCKPSLSVSESGVENFGGYKEKSVAQAWNSQYFQGESMVFVAQPNYGLNEWGKARSIADNVPLGLPVRSLKSGVKNEEGFEFVARGESGGAGSMAFPNGCNRSRNGKLGELSPINLEEKLNEAAASPSPVHWRSSSARMEKGKGEVARPSHFRPLSVDEAQFESLKTRSFRSPLSFSSETSQTSSMSSSPKEGSFANSMSSEVLNSKVENLKKRKCSQESSPSGLPSAPKPIPVNEKVSMSALHSRGYSIGSFNEEDLRRRSQDYLKELSGSRSGSGSGSEEDQLGSKEMGPGFLGSNMKPASLSKASLRGKSVRTIRGSRLTTHDKVEKLVGNDETIAMRKYAMQNGATSNKSLGNGTSKLDFGNPLHLPKPTAQKHQKMQEFCGNTAAGESEEDSESEAKSFRASSEDEDEDASSAVATSASGVAAAAAKSKSVNVATSDSEVDKKAGEFIAKFREQIRLQKVASIDRSRGPSISSNCVR